MHDSTSELLSLAGISPGHSSFEWQTIENVLGVGLPEDYRHYVEEFPPGTFQDEMITIAHPAEFPSARAFAERQLESCRELEEMRTAFDFGSHYRLYPIKGGLLPWGYVGMDFVLCWSTIGHSNQWSSVIAHPQFDWSQEYALSMTDVLAGIFNGSVRVGDLEDELAGAVDFLRYN